MSANKELREGLLEAMRNQDKALLVKLAFDIGEATAVAKLNALHSKLDKELAIAQAYGEGRVVGGNKEARDACVEGLVGAESRELLNREGAVMLFGAHMEAIKYAKQLLVGANNDA